MIPKLPNPYVSPRQFSESEREQVRSLALTEREKFRKSIAASDTPGTVATRLEEQQARIERRIQKGISLALDTYTRLRFFLESARLGEVAGGETTLTVALTSEGINLSGAFVLDIKEALETYAPENLRERSLALLDSRETAVMNEVRWLQLRRAALVDVLARYDNGTLRLSEAAEQSPADLTFATKSQRKHLRRAYLLLDFYGEETGTREDFIGRAGEMEWPEGLDAANGGAIWRGVQRLGKAAGAADKRGRLNERYTRFDGFKRLVRDLRSGALSPPG